MSVSEEEAKLNEEGRLVVQLSKALFAEDVDETFRILGRHMDKHRLQVSSEVFDEFEVGRRIKKN